MPKEDSFCIALKERNIRFWLCRLCGEGHINIFDMGNHLTIDHKLGKNRMSITKGNGNENILLKLSKGR